MQTLLSRDVNWCLDWSKVCSRKHSNFAHPFFFKNSFSRDSSLRDSSLRDSSLIDFSLRDSSLRDSSLRDSSSRDSSLRILLQKIIFQEMLLGKILLWEILWDSLSEIPRARFLKWDSSSKILQDRDSSGGFKCSLDLTLVPWLITELGRTFSGLEFRLLHIPISYMISDKF